MTATEFISYAQNAEDVVLWRTLGHVPCGSYVDVGAADPTADSVTRGSMKRWRGVNVEPVQSPLAAALMAARPETRPFAGRGPGPSPAP